MNRLRKELRITQGAGLMATALLGTGIFVVPAVAASIAGRWSLLSWLILISLVLPVAFTFALLGKRFPHAGGSAYIVRQAMGERFEKLTGFLFLLAMPVCLPAGLTMATGFWLSVFDLSHWGELTIKLGTLGLILLLGLGGARSSGNIQGLIAFLIVATVILLWWQGGVTPRDARLPLEDNASITSAFAALAVMFWCFVGIEAFTHMGEEFKNPERDFPIALLLGVVLAGLVYWACSVAIIKFGVYGSEEQNTKAIPTLIEQLLGQKAEWLAAVVGYLACFASINIYTQGFARLLWSMADEKVFTNPILAKLAILSPQKIPVYALCSVITACALSTIITDVIHLPLADLIRYANGNFIMVYLMCMLAGVKLLRGWQRGCAIISAILCIMILITLGTDALYALVLTALILGTQRPYRKAYPSGGS